MQRDLGHAGYRAPDDMQVFLGTNMQVALGRTYGLYWDEHTVCIGTILRFAARHRDTLQPLAGKNSWPLTGRAHRLSLMPLAAAEIFGAKHRWLADLLVEGEPRTFRTALERSDVFEVAAAGGYPAPLRRPTSAQRTPSASSFSVRRRFDAEGLTGSVRRIGRGRNPESALSPGRRIFRSLLPH